MLLLALFLALVPWTFCYPNYQSNMSYWYSNAQEHLAEKLKLYMQYPAKNVIFFLGDGMGPVPVTAGRIYVGQKQKKISEQEPLSWERFPYSGLSKVTIGMEGVKQKKTVVFSTYDVDSHVTDSGSSATAFLSGTKAKIWTVGVQPNVDENNCAQQIQYPVAGTIASWAQDQGKWTGFVTTTRVTHATPSGTYAHSASREWECDADKPQSASQCPDIARQLIEFGPGKNFKVIMGGGRMKFTPNTLVDPEPNYNKDLPVPTYEPPARPDPESRGEERASTNSVQYGQRVDGQNLINKWLQGPGKREYVWNRTAFEALDIDNTDYLMGLFERDHIDYKLVSDWQNRTDNPTLDQMTSAAIRLLNRSPKGYFLLVEGGRIDEALHINNMHQAMEELLWFDKAVALANDITDPADTLLVLTADHSHPVDMIGYPLRNLSILDIFDAGLADKKNTTIITFANGPSAFYHSNGTERRNLNAASKPHGVFFEQPSFMPRDIDTHGGEDVGVWARGPYSHLFTGTMENSYIAHAMAFALCVGPSRPACLATLQASSTTQPSVQTSPVPNPAITFNSPLLVAVMVLTVVTVLLLLILIWTTYKLFKLTTHRKKVRAEKTATYSNVAGVSFNPEGQEKKKRRKPRSRRSSKSSRRSSSSASSYHEPNA